MSYVARTERNAKTNAVMSLGEEHKLYDGEKMFQVEMMQGQSQWSPFLRCTAVFV